MSSSETLEPHSEQHDTEEKKTIAEPKLSIDGLRKILESPAFKANRAVLKYPYFVNESFRVLSALSSVERDLFLNHHIDETKINAWNRKKSKFMEVRSVSFQHTPLTVSLYNFTYAHTSTEASKIWFSFITQLLHFGAECDLKQCDGDECKEHLTIIDQLYAFVNTSDESLYGISTSEFAVRGGFKLLLNVFNHAGVNEPIPPLILCHNEYEKHAFLKPFADMHFDFLYSIPRNEGRFSWIKQMLYNGHPIVSDTQFLDEVLLKFYPPTKVLKPQYAKASNHDIDIDDDDEKQEDEDAETAETVDDEDMVVLGTRLSAGMNYMEVLSWLLVTLPSLLDVRQGQKRLLLEQFNQYEETVSNLALIDTVLDYLYWDERYIHEQMRNVQRIVLDKNNELTMFRFMTREYGGMVSMSMFIKGFLDLHMQFDRDVLSILFDGDVYEHNNFYFELLKLVFQWYNTLGNESYFAFLLAKVKDWQTVDQLQVDGLLVAILAFVERYVSDKGALSKMIQRYAHQPPQQQLEQQQRYDEKFGKLAATASKCIGRIFQLLGNAQYTQQFMYHLSVLHFKFTDERVAQFTLDLYQRFVNEFEIDFMYYFMYANVHRNKLLMVLHTENILWSLCRCCFDDAVRIVLASTAERDDEKKQVAIDIFKSILIDDEKYNNVFLCLAQSMHACTSTQEMEQRRVRIFRMLIEFGRRNDPNSKSKIEKALLQKQEKNDSGQNAIEIAKDNFHALYNEMKQFISE